MSDWAELPAHLLGQILENLKSSVNYLMFGLVCPSWHDVTVHDKSKLITSTQYETPMLLISTNEENIWQVYNPLQNKFLDTNLKINHSTAFSGSSNGWLASVNKDYSITIHKPYFGADNNVASSSITLPTLFPPNLEYPEIALEDFIFGPLEYHVYKILITADPLLNPERCVVVAIFGEFSWLAFIRHSTDISWTRIEGFQMFEDCLYHNDRVYAVGISGVVVCFDALKSDNRVPIFTVTSPGNSICGERYLAKTSKGELFQVLTYRKFRGVAVRKTTKIMVYKLDGNDSTWKKVESLGDLAIFIGDNTSLAVLASDFPGCQPNHIYFTHDKDHCMHSRNISDLGIYDVENKKIKWHFDIDSKSLFKMANRRPIWIVPTINL